MPPESVDAERWQLLFTGPTTDGFKTFSPGPAPKTSLSHGAE